ncbi:MAG: hypothetical protein H7A38_03605 [Chlamydiales bacterium]|nr:hypothetical protein [Chlamydiales bacterium]
MTGVKPALYRFAWNPSPETAACAKKAVQVHIELLKVMQVYASVTAGLSLVTSFTLIFVVNKEEEKDKGLTSVIGSIAFMVFTFSSVLLFYASFSRLVYWGWMKKLETFETH